MDHSKIIADLANLSIPSPCFVMDMQLLEHNLQLLEHIQDAADVNILCALKGFSFFHLFPYLKKYLGGAAASSLHEAQLIYEEMGLKAFTYCPAIIPHEAEEIMQYSNHIVFNSLAQWKTYRQLAAANDVSVGLRVNPEYSEIEIDLYNPALPTSRLGINSSDIGKVLPDGIDGLHFHVLCENTSQTLERVLTHFEEKFGHLLTACKWVNMGGGHYITRADYDSDHLIQLLNRFKQKYDVDVYLEPGTAIALDTGYLISTVLDIIDNGGIKTAILDTSFTCHMYDCLEMPYKPLVLGETENGAYEYRMGGMSCLAGDYVDGFKFDQELTIGQRIIFTDMMHYTMVKTNTFNGINLPSIGIWHENRSFELIKSFGYNDFKSRLS